MTADHSKMEFPEVNNIVQNNIYVDDCISGEATTELSFQRADELTLVLIRGGFCLKGFTFSGLDPPKALSEDRKSINVAGMKWFSMSDNLNLDIGPLDFSKRCRGKHVSPEYDIPSNLTRRQCLSKVSEIFDLTGIITPITASMKLDLHTLVQRNLSWEDVIPDDLRHIWVSHFEMIKELPSLHFRRAIIPEDAADLNIETIDCGDASKAIVCVAIYARFLRKCGSYSCQLIFSRSKLVPDGMSIPRAELFAANVNAHTGEVVRRAFRKYHKSCLKLTDSQVTLHWINNQELPLKQWVRNRVVEILRFTEPIQWSYVRGVDMPADLGTRRGATLKDVSVESIWQNGFEWMKMKPSNFPIKSYEEIKQACENSNELIKQPDLVVNRKTQYATSANSVHLTKTQENIAQRYEFSKYLIDPNKFRFQKVVRIIALVKMFIKKCRCGSNSKSQTTGDVKFKKLLNTSFVKQHMRLNNSIQTKNMRKYHLKEMESCTIVEGFYPHNR